MITKAHTFQLSSLNLPMHFQLRLFSWMILFNDAKIFMNDLSWSDVTLHRSDRLSLGVTLLFLLKMVFSCTNEHPLPLNDFLKNYHKAPYMWVLNIFFFSNSHSCVAGILRCKREGFLQVGKKCFARKAGKKGFPTKPAYTDLSLQGYSRGFAAKANGCIEWIAKGYWAGSAFLLLDAFQLSSC